MATEGIYIQGNARGCCSPPPTHHEHQYPFTNDLSHMCVHIYISHVDATHAYRHRHRLHMGTEMQTDTATVIGGERIDKRCGLYIFSRRSTGERGLQRILANSASSGFWRRNAKHDDTIIQGTLVGTVMVCQKNGGLSDVTTIIKKHVGVYAIASARSLCAGTSRNSRIIRRMRSRRIAPELMPKFPHYVVDELLAPQIHVNLVALVVSKIIIIQHVGYRCVPDEAFPFFVVAVSANPEFPAIICIVVTMPALSPALRLLRVLFVCFPQAQTASVWIM